MPFLGLMRVKTHERILQDVKKSSEEVIGDFRARNARLLVEKDELLKWKRAIVSRVESDMGFISECTDRIKSFREAVLKDIDVRLKETISGAESLLNLANGISGRKSDKQ